MKYYTGVGSRQTPIEICTLMTQFARKISSQGFILRSGGAEGADKAFECGALEKNIFYARDATKEAMEIASKFHPAWNRCSDYVKQLLCLKDYFFVRLLLMKSKQLQKNHMK